MRPITLKKIAAFASVASFLLLATPALAAISRDATSEGAASSVSNIVHAHTTGAGSNRVMFVELWQSPHVGTTPPTCDYNGDALTNLLAPGYNGGGNGNVYLYELLAPDTGTHDVTCDGSAAYDPADYDITVATYSGAAQSLATGAALAYFTDTSMNSTQTITPTAVSDGSWIFSGGWTIDGGNLAAGTNFTPFFTGGITAGDSDNTVSAGVQNVTFTASVGSSRFYVTAAAFEAAAGGDVCGDGAITGGEACDDGNADAGDGCSDTCTIEDGYECTGEPSMCSLPSSPPADESATTTVAALNAIAKRMEVTNSLLAYGAGVLFFGAAIAIGFKITRREKR